MILLFRVRRHWRRDVQGETTHGSERLAEDGPKLITRHVHRLRGGVHTLINASSYLRRDLVAYREDT